MLCIDAAGSDGMNGSAPRLVILRTGYDISKYYSKNIFVADPNDGYTIGYSNGGYIVRLGNKKYIRVGVLKLK